MATQEYEELKGFRVEVDKVIYVPHLDSPPEKPHPFVYFITIINGSTKTVTVAGRKWVVTEENGEITVVEGGGVVGERPRLKPGQRFSYNSYHVLAENGSAEGSFFGVTGEGTLVRAKIPYFRMQIPRGG